MVHDTAAVHESISLSNRSPALCLFLPCDCGLISVWPQELLKKKAQEKKLHEARLGIMEQQQRMAQVRFLVLCLDSLIQPMESKR